MNTVNPVSGRDAVYAGGDELGQLEQRLGYEFADKNLLLTALTHSSYANEAAGHGVRDYERLEFLGDAVLEMVSSEYLFGRYPEMREGELTKKRASMVREEALHEVAESLMLGKCIRLGHGEKKSGGRGRASITADVVEAIIGAIFFGRRYRKGK